MSTTPPQYTYNKPQNVLLYTDTYNSRQCNVIVTMKFDFQFLRWFFCSLENALRD